MVEEGFDFQLKGYGFSFETGTVGSREDGYRDVEMLRMSIGHEIVDGTRIPGGWPWEWKWPWISYKRLVTNHANKLIRRHEKRIKKNNKNRDKFSKLHDAMD